MTSAICPLKCESLVPAILRKWSLACFHVPSIALVWHTTVSFVVWFTYTCLKQ